MGNYVIFSSLLITITLYLIIAQSRQHVQAAPGVAANVDSTHHVRNRPFVRLSPRPMSQYARFKPDLGDFIVDDDDFFDLNKRQTSDDYGHLRFGKRDEFDDYGHMRFGRSGSDSTRD